MDPDRFFSAVFWLVCPLLWVLPAFAYAMWRVDSRGHKWGIVEVLYCVGMAISGFLLLLACARRPDTLATVDKAFDQAIHACVVSQGLALVCLALAALSLDRWAETGGTIPARDEYNRLSSYPASDGQEALSHGAAWSEREPNGGRIVAAAKRVRCPRCGAANYSSDPVCLSCGAAQLISVTPRPVMTLHAESREAWPQQGYAVGLMLISLFETFFGWLAGGIEASSSTPQFHWSLLLFGSLGLFVSGAWLFATARHR